MPTNLSSLLLASAMMLATVPGALSQLLYQENFDSYSNGDAITEVSQAFDLWPDADVTDAFVTNEAQFSGTNSLKIESQVVTGGPTDVVLTAGLEGIHEFTFRILVPPNASGYYNFQENIVAGTEWAFECYLRSDGTITFAVDPAADGSGGPEFSTYYNLGQWIEIKHEFDTDTNLMNTSIDGICVGELPYDGEEIGGLNFYAGGDGLTLPLYYVDDISVTTLEALPDCSSSTAGCTDPSAFNFDPTAEVEDGSCEYGCPPDAEGVAMHPFFSEYVEGWGTNKALEIFNPTNVAIDMSAYQLEKFGNGDIALPDERKIQLLGLISPLDVAVYTLDRRDPDGVGGEQPVWDELAAVTDHWLNPDYLENNTMYYSGNDAMVLRHIASNQIVDVFGRVGENPGDAGWAGMTQDHTLVRKAFVAQGDTDPIDDFLVVDEWTGVLWSADDSLFTLDIVFDNLGFHDFCYEATTVAGGCTDPSAFNFDPTAEVDDGSCIYFETSCAAIGAPEWEAFDLGLYAPTALSHTAGQSVTQEVVLHVPASIEEVGSGTTYAVAEWSGLEVMGMPAGLAFDNLAGLISGGSQTCLTYSGVPNVAGTYEVTLTGELFLSVFGNPVSAGDYVASLVITIEANGNAVFGCTYPHALNFNPAANDDDGSCEFAGCTDPSAENFEPYASVDDGTCETEPCVASCLGDLNNDGTIGSGDLLALLTTFGGDCE